MLKKMILTFGILGLLLMGSVLTSLPVGAEEKSQKSRDIIVIEPGPYFRQKGGDIVTQTNLMMDFKQLVFDGFTVYGPKGEMMPALAKGWKIAPNWSYVDFFIRDDVKFHNGRKVTADDVKYSYDQYMVRKYGSVMRHYLRKKVKEVTIEGPQQVRMHFLGTSAKYEVIDALRWGYGVFPREYREAVGDKEFAAHPVGAGPFQAVDIQQDQWFKVKAVKDHYRKSPAYDSLKLAYVLDPTTRFAMLLAGEADIVKITVEHADQLRRKDGFQVIKQRNLAATNLIYADLSFPDEPSPFQDIRVREAVSLAIDRDSICKKLFFGMYEPYGDVLSPVAFGYDASIKPDPYDPEKAKSLLKQAGYENGFKTKICCSPGTRSTHEAIQACLKDIGVDAELEVYERGAFLDAAAAKKLRGLFSWYSWLDARPTPTEVLKAFFGNTHGMTYYTTPEIGAALHKLEEARNKEEIEMFAKEASRIIRTSRTRSNLWVVPGLWGVNARIKSFHPQGNIFALTMLEDVELAD